MTPKEFQKYLDRDGGCLHCGATEAVAPNHRANRGMGGSKRKDVPSNIVVLCSYMNGLIEANAVMAGHARRAGWKLWDWEDPTHAPVYDAMTGLWYRLDNQYGKTAVRGAQGVLGTNEGDNV